METATPSSTSNKKYVYSTPAYWRNGGYGLAMSAPRGTLGLTTAGRVEFILDSGKLLFSVPVALTKRKYELSYGWLRIVVGPRLYTMQFHTTALSAATYEASLALAEAATKRATMKAWREHLEQAAQQAPDHEPVIAAVPTPGLLAARSAILRGWIKQSIIYLVAYWVIILVIASMGAVLHLSQGAMTIVGLVFFAALAVVIYRANRRRQKIDQQPPPPEELAIGPQDSLPPGTMASGGFGLTQGKQVLLGFLILLVMLIAVFIVAVLSVAVFTIIHGK